MSLEDLKNYYDELPYHSSPLPATSPENLQSIARMLGIDAPSPSTARVLELGGASGGNLIPIAIRYPGSECVGIDLSSVQVEDGRALIEYCGGLPNISLRQGSITEVDASWGKFDYIICHGVYSWVPEEIRNDVLRICSENLSENGVAMISFNTYPGWKGHQIIRDAMILAASKATSPKERLELGRAMVRRLLDKDVDNDLLHSALKESAPLVLDGVDSYVLHEFLEPENNAFYLKDFIADASSHGLKYLGDASFSTMFVENYPEAMQKSLADWAPESDLETHQYLDLLVNRRFRHALLVHDHHPKPEAESLIVSPGTHFTGAFRNLMDDRGQPVPNKLVDLNGMHYNAENPIFLLIAELLTRAYPASVNFTELRNELQSRARVPADKAEEMLAPYIRMMIVKGSITPLSEASQAAAGISQKPFVHPFTRRHIQRQFEANPAASRYIAWSLMHTELSLDPFGAWLSMQLDGTRDLEALVDRALDAIAQGAQIIPPEAGNVDRNILRQQIPHSLESLRRHGIISA